MREGDAAVNDDEIVALFKYRTILSDFAGPAQGDQSKVTHWSEGYRRG